MKKLFTLILLATLFVSCSSDDDNDIEPKQDYTSFVVTVETSNVLKNCVAGYYTKDGKCKKLGDLGELTKGVYSPEIRVDIDTLTRVYFFTNTTMWWRSKNPHILTKNQKNVIIIDNNTSGIEVSDWPE
ncbi:hypothetical protein M2451_001851 [Dysgonomonas sp. PFB1-18]|uniref:hypothetical protein n=1 Tax=unclassified Dysgonomonas TaxID=2630389 RepID=UPI002476D7B4|nr:MULTISPECIES: hypothetical protein [unclassified Dysgonomonas]MDH6309280.1 hypothetical protein [Dysgonomonas sp. PF1-14]MDH6338840.1 hypothetical protein [Dysgonomonas sp. PF1-16]MDH6380529.1 hypothetical protein [Dysgonomonas sp. PFB1-18]MDH6397668.1 hypothetical protein [Dysgonomonas sp. PF1-23]